MNKKEQLTTSRFFYSSVKEKGTDFWTILLLTPSAVNVSDVSRELPAMHVLSLIRKGLEMAADGWEGLRAHFSVVLDD